VAPPVFSLDTAGEDGARRARECLGEGARTVSFGVGLLFAKGTATAKKVYLNPDELQPELRRCVKTALLETHAGGPPEKNVVGEYRMRLRADGSNEVKLTAPK
jgi:hypothetical protein